MAIEIDDVLRHFTDNLIDDPILAEHYFLDGHELTESVLYFIEWQRKRFLKVMKTKRGRARISYEDVVNEYKQKKLL
jgi:hypothetical protein